MRAVAITRCGMLRLRRPFIHPTMSDRHPTMTSQTTNRDLAEVVAAIRRGDQNLATDFAAAWSRTSTHFSAGGVAAGEGRLWARSACPARASSFPSG